MMIDSNSNGHTHRCSQPKTDRKIIQGNAKHNAGCYTQGDADPNEAG